MFKREDVVLTTEPELEEGEGENVCVCLKEGGKEPSTEHLKED